jgi:hypothetical protein
MAIDVTTPPAISPRTGVPITYPDYAYSRLERFWISNEPVFNVGVLPQDADALVVLPGATVPIVAPEYVPSEERNVTPGIRATFQRKKKPSAFHLPMYLRMPPVAGTVPSWGLMAAKGFGAAVTTAGVKVTYTPATYVEEQSFSLHQWMGNEMRHIRGCLINEITIALAGTTEGRITFAGFGGNESFAGVTTLAQAMLATDTSMTLTDAKRFMAFGSTNGDTILIQIEDEVLELVQVMDYTTGVCTVARAKQSTTAAAHASGVTVGPFQPGPDPKPAELVSSCMLGTVTMAGVPMRVIDIDVTLSNALEARLDEYGQPTSTGYRRNGSRRVSGKFRAYGRQSQKALDSNLERNVESTLVIVANSNNPTTDAKATLTMTRAKIDSVSPAGDGPEFVKTYAYSALETAGNDELTLELA